MSSSDWLTALSLWHNGRDTKDIARHFGVHESVIYNGLPRWRALEAADAT